MTRSLTGGASPPPPPPSATGSPPSRDSLWLLTAAPLVWAAHFLLSYVTGAVWCAKVVGWGGSLAGVRLAIGGYTVLALAGIGVVGWRGLRRLRPRGETPHDADAPEDRRRFLGFATLLLAGLSAVATLYAALVAVFIEACH